MHMRYWRIQGYDGLDKIYQEDVSTGLFTENQLKILLQTLVAKSALDHSEIIGALARRRTKRANNLLVVRHEKPFPKYSCGENPYFTATVIKSDKE